MSRLMREKFAPLLPEVSKRESSFNAAEGLNNRRLITLAVGVHPRFAVVAAKLFEKLKNPARENGFCLRHEILESLHLHLHNAPQPTRFWCKVNSALSRDNLRGRGWPEVELSATLKTHEQDRLALAAKWRAS
jgi:hypothetical protein